MIFRIAELRYIKQMQVVRHPVKENTLTKDKVVLGTAPNTRAERFYTLQGWTPVGSYSNGEIKFELTYTDWLG